MVMVPHEYQTFQSTLDGLLADGHVTIDHIDTAVARILTAKFKMGLFEKPFADRTHLQDVGSAAHRQVAHEAVSQSLVLLKNDMVDAAPLLPIDKSSISKIVVAGKNSDNIGHQCGGWTIAWQGGSGDITPGTSVFQAIIDEVAGDDIEVEHKGDRANGQLSGDLGIVVVGETPYSEGAGDSPPANLALDQPDRAAISNICSAMPCIVVLISGRPMIITNELGDANAFVSAWLPGTEGAGITDVLFGHSDFTGQLPMTWPSDTSQIPMNVGDAIYNPLFPYGYGCTMASPCPTP